MLSSEILAETVGAIRDIVSDELKTIAIERTVIGLFFTGVKL